jgi:hypothetical protein
MGQGLDKYSYVAYKRDTVDAVAIIHKQGDHIVIERNNGSVFIASKHRYILMINEKDSTIMSSPTTFGIINHKLIMRKPRTPFKSVTELWNYITD